MSIKRTPQLELENFAMSTEPAEEADGALLSVADVRAREIVFLKVLEDSKKLDDGEAVPSWAETYNTLLNANVRPRIAAFVAWATMPKKYRWPETQEQLATEVLGLRSDRVIATWRKKYPEIDAMISVMQAEAMLEYRPGAFHALGTVASDPSYRAASDRKLFFEMTGDHTPKQKIETDARGVGGKVLDKLKKLSSAELVATLGADAIDLVKELEDEVNDVEDIEADEQ